MKIAATLLTLLLAATTLAETPQPVAAGDAFMHHYDSDKDGKISAEEYEEALAGCE